MTSREYYKGILTSLESYDRALAKGDLAMAKFWWGAAMELCDTLDYRYQNYLQVGSD